MREPVRIRVHLGSGEEGERRKAALQQIAAREGFLRDGEGNISGWLSSLADRETVAEGVVRAATRDLRELAEAEGLDESLRVALRAIASQASE